MNKGEIVHNVKCEECGDLMRTAEVRKHGRLICDRCLFPILLPCGNMRSAHYDDDPSGASSSWDMAVARCEDA